MKIIKDLVPNDSSKLYRYEIVNSDGTGTGTYTYLKYAPDTLAQVPTPVNAALLEDMYGYSEEVVTIGTDGSITTVSGDVTETISIDEETNTITQTKTDGTKTITMTMTITEGETSTVITKAVS